MAQTFRSVALVGNTGYEQVSDCLSNLTSHLAGRGVKVVADAKQADLVIAVGGDGTLLYAAHSIGGRSIPLLGVNRGRLGFLTDISPQSMLQDVDSVLDGRYTEDKRALLLARLECKDAVPKQMLALNDVVIQKLESGRILDLETWIDKRFVNSHGGDGLVIATATGSTAYALSCGGPIVEPNLDVWVLAPISPHTLSDRPILVRADSRIEVNLSARPNGGALVNCDGAPLGELAREDRLSVEKADAHVTLLHPPGYDYYRLLRSKLHWGRGDRDKTGAGDPSPDPHR